MVQCWYVGETEPSAESKAQLYLDAAGFRTFCPTIVALRVYRGRKLEVEQPLFPRYLFIAMDLDAPLWRAVYSQPGMLRVLSCRTDGMPEPIRDIAVIEALLGAPRRMKAEEVMRRLLVGTRVRVKCGPLSDHLATISKSEKARVRLLTSLLGGSETDWLPADWVEALTAEASEA